MLVADQEIEAFRSAILGKNLTSSTRLNSRSQQVFRAEIGGVLCILKVVRHIRASATERHTNAFHRLARALSPRRMSSPAVLTRFTSSHSGVPANTDMVVTELAPSIYRDGDDVARDAVRRIGSEDRHLGAILSYIAHLSDHGVLRNFLFRTNQTGEFPFWFIDLDFAFGATMWWGDGKSVFFPGCELSYQAARSATGLPAFAAELLGLIDRLPRQEVSRIFGLPAAEANDLQARCSKVRRLGLAAAIERERFWTPADGLLTCWKETAYAKFLIACRLLRPGSAR